MVHKSTFNVIYIILLIIVILCGYHYYRKIRIRRENFLTYKRCNEKKLQGIMRHIFDKNNIKKTEGNKWDIYIPCGYNFIENELITINSNKKNQKIFGISGCDKIVSKNSLWSLLEKKYGRSQSSKIMPETFILGNKKDMDLFSKKFDKKKLYILKKNIQRKKGLKLSKNYYEILNSIKDGFKVVQEYKKNTFIIKKRKFNLRVYMLIICVDDHTEVYIHNEGKCLFASKNVSSNDLDFESNISDSYKLESDFYKNYPLTFKDLEKYMNKNGYRYSILSNNIEKLIKKMVASFSLSLCNLENIKFNTKFQLFGIDIIFDKNLKPLILEINKGPDMVPKDDLDSQLKTKIEMDMLTSLDIIKKNKNHQNGFKLIYKNK